MCLAVCLCVCIHDNSKMNDLEVIQVYQCSKTVFVQSGEFTYGTEFQFHIML